MFYIHNGYAESRRNEMTGEGTPPKNGQKIVNGSSLKKCRRQDDQIEFLNDLFLHFINVIAF